MSKSSCEAAKKQRSCVFANTMTRVDLHKQISCLHEKMLREIHEGSAIS